MDTMKRLPVIAAPALPTAANVVVLVETSDPGFYNNSLGTVLNNTNGGNTSMGYFSSSNDAYVDFPVAPDLNVAVAAPDDWLTDPCNLNSNRGYLESIPNMWDTGTEVAVIYQFDSLEDHGTTNGYDVLIAADKFTPAVPVPAAFWLFGYGLVGLVGLARQRV
jgi:hypothetical protein